VAALRLAETAGDRTAEHREILAAVTAGEPERAVAALSAHLQHSVDLSAEQLAAEQGVAGEPILLAPLPT
jgi:DNA-binding GntR family transcriptional regulator